MKFEHGEIYFVREQINGIESKNVKIGLVNSPKTSEERLIQLRTGNPNRLYIANKITTDAVHYVEKQLHKKYADKRISGEWFDLGNPELFEKALQDALALSKDIATKMQLITRAESLDTEFQNLPPVAPTDEIKEVAAELARSELLESALKKLKKDIMAHFKAKSEEEGAQAIEKFFREITVYPKPRFDDKDFVKTESEETVKKYTIIEGEKAVSTFALVPKFKKSIGLGDQLSAQIAEYTDAVAKAKSSNNLVDLYSLREEVEREEKIVEWPLTYLEAELKVFCNLASGIEGIATWDRQVDLESSIDEGRLYLEDSPLYIKYLKESAPYTRKIQTYRKESN